MLATVTVVGIVVLAFLVWYFLRTRSKDLVTEIMERRRPSSRLVTRADYVEGMNHVPVALSLTNDTVYYENPDMQASFELARIDDVEYDDELTTGKSVPAGSRALRLRSHGSTFEFVLSAAETPKWESALPPKRVGTQSTAKAG
ncbi:MAG TPA: hypothetical protein VLV78_13290 [Thermoanaerobaculia bacterium]|nr:hypothetical protein [Thermoanaerobaculia bacterium]